MSARASFAACVCVSGTLVAGIARAEGPQAASDGTSAGSTPQAPVFGFVQGEGFRLLSSDQRWRLHLGLQAAAAYQPTFLNDTANWSSFRIPYARLRLDGHLLRKWIRYNFSFEFADFPPYLLDGYLEVQPWRFFGVRAGQMYTPISSHENLDPQELVFPEWALTANYFGTGWDKGIQVFGEMDLVDYYVGLYGASPPGSLSAEPGHFQLMARLTVHPLGPLGSGEIPYILDEGPVPFRFSFSLQGYWGKVTPTISGSNPSNGLFQRVSLPERKQAAAAAELQVQWGRFGVFAEYYARRVEPTIGATAPFWQQGTWVQVHYTVYRRVLDVALRFNWIDPSNLLKNDQFVSGEAQLAWYPAAPYLSLKLRYAVVHQQDPGPAPGADPTLLDDVHLLLTPGTGHLGTLQASVYF